MGSEVDNSRILLGSDLLDSFDPVHRTSKLDINDHKICWGEKAGIHCLLARFADSYDFMP